jgi:large subunit ribosomal protein L13
MKTYRPTEKDFDRKTYLIDADGKTLGRLATKTASLLIGKGKPVFAPDQMAGDYVVIVNAAKVHISGKKKEQKLYTHYSGFPGGLKTCTFEDLLEKNPELVILRAVERMLPKNKLGREMLRRLRVYAGKEHRQSAQKPVLLEG